MYPCTVQSVSACALGACPGIKKNPKRKTSFLGMMKKTMCATRHSNPFITASELPEFLVYNWEVGHSQKSVVCDFPATRNN